MKVANITLHAINNYGSVLQTFATEKIFQDLGCEVETIDYVRETAQSGNVFHILKYGGPGFILKMKQLISYFLYDNSKRKLLLDEFRKSYLHLSKQKYLSDKELEENPPMADIYCTGSDQTWNTVCQGSVPHAYFLHFVPSKKKKISFSASFGIDSLPQKDRAEVLNLLSSYHSISVRESSGLKILRLLGFHNAKLVLDPTLVVNPAVWYGLASQRIVEEDYILAYQLNQNNQYVEYVNSFAKVKGLKVVLVRSHKESIDNCIFMPDITPQDLLSLFKYSSYVITDSFHATVFSIVFHRQFLNIYPPKYSTRLDSILELTGLKSRKVTDFHDFSLVNQKIDYSSVDEIIENERGDSISFLKSSITC